MIIDARIPRPKVVTLTPDRVQLYHDWREETRAKGTYVGAIQSTAI